MDHPQQAAGYNWPAMWTTTTSSTPKRKHEYSPSYDSWEEQAFAEDAAGLLGSSGCVWPPRSYTCTFCRREFRSAQALGGHMNVHRRDRARLKQLPPNTPTKDDHQSPLNPNYPIHGNSHHLLKPTFLMSCPNPNSKGNLFYPSSSSSSSSLPIFQQEKSSPFAIERPMSTREMQFINFPPPHITWSSEPSSTSSFHRRSRHEDNKETTKIISLECEEENEGDINFVKSELSISLSLVVRRNLPVEEAKASCFKRRKVDTTSSPKPSLPLILISSEASSTGIDQKSKIDHSPREVNLNGLTNPYYSLKDIDLELRLGG